MHLSKAIVRTRDAYLQTEDEEEKPAFVSDSRTVNLAGGVPADKTAGFAANNIKTAKYNLITFFPIFLFEMFSRAAYLYFLAQVCLCLCHVSAVICSLLALCSPSGSHSQGVAGLCSCSASQTRCSKVATHAYGAHSVLCAGLPVMVERCLPLFRFWVHSSFGIRAHRGCYQGHL